MLFASAPMPAEKDAPFALSLSKGDSCVAGGSTSHHERLSERHCGLRAYFFGLAALAWFIQPWAFVLATCWVVGVLYWRDSRSATLATLAGRVTEKGLP